MNIIITGFMGTGKTTVGRILSQKLGRFHLDTDELIERKAGQTISTIFERFGESYFRRLEKSVIEEISKKEKKAVISTGGKTLLDEENLTNLSRKGIILTLIDEPSNCWERIRTSSNRPLVKNNDYDCFWQLYQEREQLYQNLPNKIEIEGLSTEEVVEKVLFSLNSKLYEFEVGQGKEKTAVSIKRFIDFKPEELIENNESRLFLIYDQKINDWFQTKTLEAKLKWLPVKATDVNKNLRQAEKIWKWLLTNGVKRDSILISAGGGVVGDLGGFVSSTILRGIKHIHFPTTLLAMVDSCLGGKNGINYDSFKNCLGTFALPKKVIINPLFLYSLSELDLATGLVEAIKVGLIGDQALVDLIDNKMEMIRRKDIAVLEEIIWRALQVKKKIVEEDLYESGERKKLNLGHTLGHALEALHNYKISHGEAVAIGLLYSLRVSELLNLTDFALRERIRNLFLRLGLKVRIRGNKAELLKLIEKDKKNTEKGLDFVLFSNSTGVGLRKNIDKKILFQAMQEVIDEDLSS
ncbi:MAG: bifunctional shikimate kinase/3-dehydroquinate synthase [Candidatus Saccharicenans sp.]|nr:MAG: hypothetical protein C0168_11590 [Candidatus Aminicenantes bacterium]HEK86327.1 hypothetical protein [Candidatus Aminicenantes bacterium]